MKFLETHYEEYLNSNKKKCLQEKIVKNIIKTIPSNIQNFKNIILYGPSGVGKFTTALLIIKKYSPSELKYEKKITMVPSFDKDPFYFKISDVHYEIDISLLGCNSKILWHEIYQQIIDIISSKTNKEGIILCKYFNEIQNELLDNFYSYMQTNNYSNLNIKFIIITENLSFIHDNILNCCEIINFSRPSQSSYNKILKTKINKNTPLKLETIDNIKNLYCNIYEPIKHYKIICEKIVYSIIHFNNIDFIKLRDSIYDIFIYNLDINEVILNILNRLLETYKININDFSKIMIKTHKFFKFYNNNYRPIYHVELYIYYLISVIHFENSNKIIISKK